MKSKAKVEAEQVKTDALNGAREDVGQIAVNIAEALIKKDLNADDQKELIDAYIKGLTNADETR